MSQVIYDCETYPNFFALGLLHAHSDYYAEFECSEFRDDSEAMFATLGMLMREGVEMVGFNNIGFDYPVVHHLIRTCFDARGERQIRYGVGVAKAAYEKAEQIIRSNDRFANTVWQNERMIPQLDLYKVNHFDNPAKATSLKVLQFTMRAPSVEDLPIAPGTRLTAEQAVQTMRYMRHDIDETKRFAGMCAAEIDFRRTMARELNGDVMNWSDVKIGSEYLIQRLGKELCYTWESGSREARQTVRREIPVGPILFPYIKFRRPECQSVLERFRGMVIRNTKAAVSDAIELDGFTFDFGTGGIHGSVSNGAFKSDDAMVIKDADVTSLYPSIAIENKLYPEHLGERYCVEYAALRTQRKQTKKGDPRNAALKLALNGTYGNTNNPFSPFYDPQYTMATTINGQLLLLMLAERLLEIPDLRIIQINTDGVTCHVPRGRLPQYDAICAEWQTETKLELEFADFAAFFCRDVNNYLAVKTDGGVKSKGAYDYPRKQADYSGWWHRDYSALCVQKAVEGFLVRGVPVEIGIRDNRDPFDFMCRFKTPGGSKLLHGGSPQQRVTRYYVAVDAPALVKQSPPPEHPWVSPGAFKRKNGISDTDFYKVLREIAPGSWDARIHTANKSVYGDREMTVCGSARICNRATDFNWSDVAYEWYIAEALKLTDCFAG